MDTSLTLPLRVSEGAEPPTLGEAIKVRLPFSIPGPGSLYTPGSRTSSSRGNYHTVFVKTVIPDHANRCMVLQVWVAPSFSRPDNNGLASTKLFLSWPESTQRQYLPLPTSEEQTPTPADFVQPLYVGGWVNSRPAWLSVVSDTVRLPFDKPFKRHVPTVSLSFAEQVRIEAYAKRLLAVVLAQPSLGGGDANDDASDTGEHDNNRSLASRGGFGGGSERDEDPSPGGGSGTGGGYHLYSKQTLHYFEANTSAGLHNTATPLGNTWTVCDMSSDDDDEDEGDYSNLLGLLGNHEAMKEPLRIYQKSQVENVRLKVQEWMSGISTQ